LKKLKKKPLITTPSPKRATFRERNAPEGMG